MSWALFFLCTGYGFWLDTFSGRHVEAPVYFYLGQISITGFLLQSVLYG